MFSSFGFQRHVETAPQTQTQSKAGSFVVARTKHVEQIGNVVLKTQDPKPETPSQTPQRSTRGLQGRPKKQHMNTQEEPTIVIPRVQILPQPSREPVPHVHAPLAQTVKEPVTCPVPEEKKSSPLSQSHTSKSRTREKPDAGQSNKTSPHPPVMVCSEVLSKAQSMARSRLEKARFHLQGRIQQAIKLFGGKDMSESQAKRKQVQF